MVSKKEKILKEVKTQYLKSQDYNGLSIYNMKNYDYPALCELIDDNKIFVLNENDTQNPHINGYGVEADKNKQKINVNNQNKHSVLYPTKESLKRTRNIVGKPYSNMLRKGYHQFHIIYFDIGILDKYFEDPRFEIYDLGYRGSIYPKDKYANEITISNEYIKDYGMAYVKGEHLNRAVGVFVRDLASLTPKTQQLWKGFEKERQEECIICDGFIKNLMCGDWVEEIWIFEAALRIMIVINEQCEAMSIPPLFKHTFDVDNLKLPEGYRLLFSPTKKNYEAFVVVIEKLFVENISIDTFQKNAPFVKAVERKDKNGQNKGSLQMFEEWLEKNIKFREGNAKEVLKPLRYIRKIRQIPAHEISPNAYDIQYYEKQLVDINSLFNCISNVMLLLSTHPLAKAVNIPDWFYNDKKIVNY